MSEWLSELTTLSCPTEYADFSPVNLATVTFSPTTSHMDYNLSLVDNMILEDTETFTISFSLVNNSVGVVLGTDSVAVATILDDDEATLQFVICDQSIWESDGSLEISVIKTGLTDIPVTVFVQSNDRTATGG